jgi:hypothetical protein
MPFQGLAVSGFQGPCPIKSIQVTGLLRALDQELAVPVDEVTMNHPASTTIVHYPEWIDDDDNDDDDDDSDSDDDDDDEDDDGGGSCYGHGDDDDDVMRMTMIAI